MKIHHVTPFGFAYPGFNVKRYILEHMDEHPELVPILTEISYCSPMIPQEIREKLGMPIHTNYGECTVTD